MYAEFGVTSPWISMQRTLDLWANLLECLLGHIEKRECALCVAKLPLHRAPNRNMLSWDLFADIFCGMLLHSRACCMQSIRSICTGHTRANSNKSFTVQSNKFFVLIATCNVSTQKGKKSETIRVKKKILIRSRSARNTRTLIRTNSIWGKRMHGDKDGPQSQAPQWKW